MLPSLSKVACLALVTMVTAGANAPTARAQDSSSTTPAESQHSPKDLRLANYLSGTQFIGKFTVDGQDVAKTETYTITSCEKLDLPDVFRFKARIKYGDVDQEVPLDLKVLWSGNTPVITLDSLWIPTMGTFDARVLIQPGKEAGRYAGTWQHGDHGGHLFGKIVKIEETANQPTETK
ncbi:hypothetical protein [Rhodopirellula sp. MGV]|uniref:hypothetical protein n=1 Tax=Rhodopirellula sp. MGV TaxID=2023130 RepID=UPI000B97890E|nr:hypothetical protein [Rhodopirellula sp. MGV]OYP31102.1 hypothetical protein CGZ80_21605 [Rhodopirellula sp. MGV]PNY37475.1 hypothetical protein C2E31_08120 [Rhodopirellula baltica]